MPPNYQEIILQTSHDHLSVVRRLYEVADDEAEERVEKFLNWYKLQPHFPKLDQEKTFLYRYLSMNKFDVEKSKWKLENFFSARTSMPEFFADRDPLNGRLQQAFEYVDWLLLPRMTPERERIQILKLKKTATANLYDAEGAYKLLCLLIDFRLMYDTSISDRFIFDGTDCEIDHIVRTPPAILKKILFLIQNCYAGRINGFHFINCPSFINTLVVFSKTIVKKKLADKYHFHKSLDDLHKFVPAKYLTKEYGGNIETNSEISTNIKKAFESDEIRKWFIQSENLKSDESKRLQENSWSMDDMLGITGTFRKLNVD